MHLFQRLCTAKLPSHRAMAILSHRMIIATLSQAKKTSFLAGFLILSLMN